MKKIELPVFRVYKSSLKLLTLQELQEKPGEVDSNGIKWVDGGMVIETQPLNIFLDQARDNGGKVIWATVCIEKRLESIISDYLFEYSIGVSNEKKQFFDNEILETSMLEFSNKRKIALDVIEKVNLLEGKNKDTFNTLLKKVAEYRNAFAHGNIIADAQKGCILNYYSGGQKEVLLDDPYWEKLEGVFKQIDILLKEVQVNLEGYSCVQNSNLAITESMFKDLEKDEICKEDKEKIGRMFLPFLNQMPCLRDIQQIRKQWTCPTKQEAFEEIRQMKHHWYIYNCGGRNEAQFNIGLKIKYFRIGLGFEFSEKDGGNPELMQNTFGCFVDAVKTQLTDFKQFIQDNFLQIEWHLLNNYETQTIVTDKLISWIDEKSPNIASEYIGWIFIGRLLDREKDKVILNNPQQLANAMDSVFRGFKGIWEQTQIMAHKKNDVKK